MKIATQIIFFLILSNFGFSQVDYLDLKNQLKRTCGVPDSTTLIQSQNFLDSIIQLEVINGQEKLLSDIGMIYYKRYLKWEAISDIEKSKYYYSLGWETYTDKSSLWNLGNCYGILGDCKEKLRLTDLYIKVMKEAGQEEFISYKQVYLRYKNCAQ